MPLYPQAQPLPARFSHSMSHWARMTRPRLGLCQGLARSSPAPGGERASRRPGPEAQGLHGGLAALPQGVQKHREALSGCFLRTWAAVPLPIWEETILQRLSTQGAESDLIWKQARKDMSETGPGPLGVS